MTAMADVMEMLRQIQQEQKESMKNLYYKLNLMEGKIIELDKKINQQQANSASEDTINMSPAGFNTNQINQLDEKLNRVIDMYQSDTNGIKSLINSFKSAANLVRITGNEMSPIYFSQNQICQLDNTLKGVTDEICTELIELKELIKHFEALHKRSIYPLKATTKTNQTEIKEIKELVKKVVARPMSADNATEASSLNRTQKSVQISSTYLSADQINKLNSDLKKITQMYQATNILPVIEVISGPAVEHPFVKQLRKGVFYQGLNGAGVGKVKLGVKGLKESDAIDMIIEYPDLTFKEVVQNLLEAHKEWEQTKKSYDLGSPKIYNKQGKLVPLKL